MAVYWCRPIAVPMGVEAPDARVHRAARPRALMRAESEWPSEADSTEFVVELPSDLGLIEAAVGYLVGRCRDFHFSGPRLELNFRVGVTEAIANAVLYGNRSDPEKIVLIEVAIDTTRVVIHVADEGDGFDPETVPDPTLPPYINAPGGRGLFLIRRLMDEIQFNDRGNVVRMVLLREVIAGRTA